MKYFILIGFLVLQIQSFAQAEANVAIGLTSNEIKIGDQLYATIQLQFDKSVYDLQFPRILPEIWQPLQIVKTSAIDTSQEGNMVTMKQVLTITCFDTGIITLAPLVSVGQITTQSTVVEIASDSIKIHVQGVLIDKNGDIKDIVLVSSRDEMLKSYAAIAIIALSIFIVFFVLWKNKKRTSANQVKIKTALQQLELIQNNSNQNQQESKDNFSELVAITKQYFATKWNIAVLDKPSAEGIYLLSNHIDTQQFAPVMEKVWKLADAIKFAKQQATLPQYQEAWQYCFDSITSLENTRLKKLEDLKMQEKQFSKNQSKQSNNQ
jgi:hypothetical protein